MKISMLFICGVLTIAGCSETNVVTHNITKACFYTQRLEPGKIKDQWCYPSWDDCEHESKTFAKLNGHDPLWLITSCEYK